MNQSKVIDLLIYKNYYALIKTLHVFLGNHNKSFIWRHCLNSYTIENALMIHKKNAIAIIYALLEHQTNHIDIGKNTFIRNHYNLGYTQNSKLIMKKINLVQVI